MRLLISGASGFIGKPLVSFFEAKGNSVETLSSENASIAWDPQNGKANPSDFEDFDAVIHLAGEPLTLSRWGKSKREKILHSRSVDTMFLSHLLSSAMRPPKVFISASAVGYYGDRGEELLTEESEAGSGFLAHVCCAWEKASASLRERGVRTVQTRFGIVIGPKGGILKKILPAYKLGLAGPLGSGKQWVSWIHREDLIRAISFLIDRDEIEGPVNLVAPQPVRQKDFAKTIADLLCRPSFLPTPAWVLKLFLGQTAEDLILASQKVQCSKLLAAKFAFNYSDLRSAVYNALQV